MTTTVSSSYTDSTVLSQHTLITGVLSMVLLHHTQYPLPDFGIYDVLSRSEFADMLMIRLTRYLVLVFDFKESRVPFYNLISRRISNSECRKYQVFQDLAAVHASSTCPARLIRHHEK